MKDMKPMLAHNKKFELSELRFPLYASPKLDGIRALCHMGDVLSRSLKMIPNRHVQKVLKDLRLHGLDGELIVGDATNPNAMQAASSGIMSRGGQPVFTFHIFDLWHKPNVPFFDRYAELKDRAGSFHMNGWGNFELVPQVLITDLSDLKAYEEQQIEKGFEGVILRGLEGLYKYGRSTLREHYLLKLKRFKDSEAVITGFEPKLHNTNVQTRDERGYAKRSKHQANMVVLDTLGVILGTDLKTGKPVRVGGGYTDELRKHIWENQKKYLNKVMTYTFFPHGVKDLPRHTNFKAFRDKRDMS